MRQIRVKTMVSKDWQFLSTKYPDTEEGSKDCQMVAEAVHEALIVGMMPVSKGAIQVDIVVYPNQMTPDGDLTQEGADDVASLIWKEVERERDEKRMQALRTVTQRYVHEIGATASQAQITSYDTFRAMLDRLEESLADLAACMTETLAPMLEALKTAVNVSGTNKTLETLRVLGQTKMFMLPPGSLQLAVEQTPGQAVQAAGMVPPLSPPWLGEWQINSSGVLDYLRFRETGSKAKTYLPPQKTSNPAGGQIAPPPVNTNAAVAPAEEEKPAEKPVEEPAQIDWNICANCGAIGKPLYKSGRYAGRVCGGCYAKEL